MPTTKLGLTGTPAADTAPQSFNLFFNEYAAVNDQLLADASAWHLSFHEGIGIVEGFVKSAHYHKSFSVSIGAEDDPVKNQNYPSIIKYFREMFAKYFHKNIVEAWDVDDLTYVTRVQRYEENYTVTDSISKRLHRGFSESFAFIDKTKLPSFVYDTIEYTDDLNRIVGAGRAFAYETAVADAVFKLQTKRLDDEVTYTEVFTKKLTKNVYESLVLHDTLLRNANAVVFDFVIRSDVLTKEQLATLMDCAPVGYTEFRTLYPGDYEYEKAFIGVRLTNISNEGQVGIQSLKHNVDVPDVTDRGNAEVTSGDMPSGEVYVPFTKTYTAIPEVYPTWTSGPTAAVPEILTVTLSGFTFILRDASTPSIKVQGSLSWASIGR